MASRLVEVARPVEPVSSLHEVRKESDLIAQLRAGESEAIKVLFNSYFNQLYSFIFYSVDRDHSVAEDIVQETFLNAIKSAKGFKGNSNVYTWLVGIAHHKIADYYRQLKKERKYTICSHDDSSQILTDLKDDSISAENLAELAETNLVVAQVMQNLPFYYRQVLLLKYVEDLHTIDICHIMGRSLKSIEGLLHRAKKAFKESLNYN